MRISVPALVYGGWFVVIGVMVVSNLLALYQGFFGRWSQLTWREIKFAATLGGAFSIFFLMLNFETLVRSDFVGKATPAHILTYTHAKFLVAKRYAAECGTKPADAIQQRICSDLSTVFDQIDYIPVRDRNPMSHIDVANRAPQLQKFFTDVNKAIDQVNLYAENAEDRYQTLSPESRLGWTLLAGLLLPLCLAGSVGEAAFQLREANRKAAEDAAKQQGEKPKASPATAEPETQQQGSDGSAHVAETAPAASGLFQAGDAAMTPPSEADVAVTSPPAPSSTLSADPRSR